LAHDLSVMYTMLSPVSSFFFLLRDLHGYCLESDILNKNSDNVKLWQNLNTE
jgi:hypothetical protein